MTGQVPNVVFLECLVRERNRWLFNYGAADKFIGVAAALAKCMNRKRLEVNS